VIWFTSKDHSCLYATSQRPIDQLWCASIRKYRARRMENGPNFGVLAVVNVLSSKTVDMHEGKSMRLPGTQKRLEPQQKPPQRPPACSRQRKLLKILRKLEFLRLATMPLGGSFSLRSSSSVQILLRTKLHLQPMHNSKKISLRKYFPV